MSLTPKGRQFGTAAAARADLHAVLNLPDDQLLSVEVTAVLLGVSAPILLSWRTHKRGPAYAKVGERIRYRLGDLRQFVRERLIHTKEQPASLADGSEAA